MSTTVSARLPDDLLAWMKTQPEKTNNELILNALYALKEQRSKGGKNFQPDPIAPMDMDLLKQIIDYAIAEGAIQIGDRLADVLTSRLQGTTFPLPLNKEPAAPDPILRAKRPSKNHQPEPEPIPKPEPEALEEATTNFLNMFG